MNIIEFTDNLKNSKNISIRQTVQLEDIIEEFPYFQAAHYLHLNGLKNQNSFKYNHALKKAAAYTTDRSVLFDLISADSINANSGKKNIELEDSSENIETENSELIENKSEDLPDIKEKNSELETSAFGKPLCFDTSETHSFNEWLQITSIKPIQRGEKQEMDEDISSKYHKNQALSSKRNFELIEKFIASNPKIKPTKTLTHNDISHESIIEDENLMTETLAHVYVEQKKYQKAITAFTVLSLKYPEKNSFFANRIEAIKKLQEK